MRKTIPGFLLALTLAGTLGLAGCGDDESSDASSSDEPTSSSAPSEDSAGGESTPAETATAPDPDPATSEAPEQEEGDGDKPSREDVIAGYEKIITAGAGTTELPADIVAQTATCFVDELYDKASAQTLQAIADEDATGIDPDDASLFGDAGAACVEAAGTS